MSLDARVAEEINEAVNVAMRKICRAGFDGFKNEREFEAALLAELRSKPGAWKWESQAGNVQNVALQAEHFLNNERLIPDFLGDSDGNSVLIEIKYNMGVPRDTLAFPYDILKDCLKVELALEGKATGPSRNFVYGLCIGLTNWKPHWDQNATVGRNAWSRNAFEIMRNTEEPFPQRCHVVSRGIADYTSKIYTNRRLHLSFGYEWKRAWAGPGNGFRYIIYQPTKRLGYLEEPDESFCAGDGVRIDVQSHEYLPFADRQQRENYLRERALRKSKKK